MDQAAIDEAARLLVEARRSGTPLTGLPDSCRPRSNEDAFAIQDAVARRLGEAIGGWKVGAAAAGEPAYCAPIFARLIRPSPASFAKAELRIIAIEAEIAFRLDRDLPARSQPYEPAEVIAAVTMHPAIEVVDSRYADLRQIDKPGLLADNFSNGGLVYGAPLSDWRARDLKRPAITVTEDGKPFAETLPNPGRDPIAALVDFANLMRGRGGATAGIFVTTGSFTGMVFTRPGARILAEYGPLGRVEVSFSA